MMSKYLIQGLPSVLCMLIIGTFSILLITCLMVHRRYAGSKPGPIKKVSLGTYIWYIIVCFNPFNFVSAWIAILHYIVSATILDDDDYKFRAGYWTKKVVNLFKKNVFENGEDSY